MTENEDRYIKIDLEKFSQRLPKEMAKVGINASESSVERAIESTVAEMKRSGEAIEIAQTIPVRDTKIADDISHSRGRAEMSLPMPHDLANGSFPPKLLLVAAGGIAAYFTLSEKYPEFLMSLGNVREFFKALGLSEMLGFVAYAQTTGGAGGAGTAVAPFFIYLIYIAFTIGYVGCVFGLFFGREAKDRAHAMEMLKTLTAFFVGVASGKIV